MVHVEILYSRSNFLPTPDFQISGFQFHLPASTKFAVVPKKIKLITDVKAFPKPRAKRNHERAQRVAQRMFLLLCSCWYNDYEKAACFIFIWLPAFWETRVKL